MKEDLSEEDIKEFKREMKIAEKTVEEWIKWRRKTKGAFLAPDIVLLYFLGDPMATRIVADAGEDIRIVTSDYCLYEALSCLTQEEISSPDFVLNLIRFIFSVEIIASPKFKISEEKIKHLREVAIKSKKKNIEELENIERSIAG